jgi:hypothetical protein
MLPVISSARHCHCHCRASQVTSLRRLIESDILDHVERLRQISDRASQEWAIEKALGAVEQHWRDFMMPMEHDGVAGRRVVAAAGLTAAAAALEEHVAQCQAMLASQYAGSYQRQLEHLLAQLHQRQVGSMARQGLGWSAAMAWSRLLQCWPAGDEMLGGAAPCLAGIGWLAWQCLEHACLHMPCQQVTDAALACLLPSGPAGAAGSEPEALAAAAASAGCARGGQAGAPAGRGLHGHWRHHGRAAAGAGGSWAAAGVLLPGAGRHGQAGPAAGVLRQPGRSECLLQEPLACAAYQRHLAACTAGQACS